MCTAAKVCDIKATQKFSFYLSKKNIQLEFYYIPSYCTYIQKDDYLRYATEKHTLN